MTSPQAITIFDSLQRTIVPLQPLTSGHIKIYACGVTVYDDCHIGHGMQAVFFDVIRSFLVSLGYQVTYVRNFTDVDDKIIARAKNLGISPRKLADDVINTLSVCGLKYYQELKQEFDEK